MLNEPLIRLLNLMHIHPPTAEKALKRLKFSVGNKKKTPKFGALPDNVWDTILDNLSPFELIKMRRVNQLMKALVEKRRRRLLYADFLRADVNAILPPEVRGDGEFFRHPISSRIIAHEESRSVLVIVDTHWTVNDAFKMMALIRYYGANAHTITLDASLAELCVASQSTSDIPFWFTFQSSLGTSDPVTPLSQNPNWVPDEFRIKSVQSYEQDQIAAYTQWTPRTQLIPVGPLFPKATELTIRSSIPQLRRLRRFGIYRSPLTRSLCDATSLHMLRVVISTSTTASNRKSGGPARQVTQSLKLAPFLKWANAQKLAHRFSVQFV